MVGHEASTLIHEVIPLMRLDGKVRFFLCSFFFFVLCSSSSSLRVVWLGPLCTPPPPFPPVFVRDDASPPPPFHPSNHCTFPTLVLPLRVVPLPPAPQLDDLLLCVHVHPALSEIVRNAARRAAAALKEAGDDVPLEVQIA